MNIILSCKIFLFSLKKKQSTHFWACLLLPLWSPLLSSSPMCVLHSTCITRICSLHKILQFYHHHHYLLKRFIAIEQTGIKLKKLFLTFFPLPLILLFPVLKLRSKINVTTSSHYTVISGNAIKMSIVKYWWTFMDFSWALLENSIRSPSPLASKTQYWLEHHKGAQRSHKSCLLHPGLLKCVAGEVSAVWGEEGTTYCSAAAINTAASCRPPEAPASSHTEPGPDQSEARSGLSDQSEGRLQHFPAEPLNTASLQAE